MKTYDFMKFMDVVVLSLLVIGGLNWGLVGFFDFDLVASLFGTMSILSRVVYVLVGLCALYEALQVRAIPRRWGCAWPKLAQGVAQ